jgi:hypothetical protein
LILNLLERLYDSLLNLIVSHLLLKRRFVYLGVTGFVQLELIISDTHDSDLVILLQSIIIQALFYVEVVHLDDPRLYVLIELNRKVLPPRVDDVERLIVVVRGNKVKALKASVDVLHYLFFELRQILLVIHLFLRVPN